MVNKMQKNQSPFSFVYSVKNRSSGFANSGACRKGLAYPSGDNEFVPSLCHAKHIHCISTKHCKHSNSFR